MVSPHAGSSPPPAVFEDRRPISARYLHQRSSGRWRYVLIAVIVEALIGAGIFVWIDLTSQAGKIPPRQLAARVKIERPPKRPLPPKLPPPKVIPPKLIPQHPLPPPVTPHMPPIEPIPSLPAGVEAATATAAPPPSTSAHVVKPLDVYVAELHTRIQDSIQVVRMVRRLSLSGTVLVRFTLSPGGGSARGIQAIGGSKNPLLIQSALDTVRALVFPPFLAGIPHHSIIFDVPIQIHTMS